jgi:lipoyl(octanoyl) transferase
MADSVSTTPEWVVAPGPVPYPEAMEAMRARVVGIRSGKAAERVWLLEHPPLYTSGTSARPGDLLNQGGFDTFEAGRGGQWTYHGPGQLVAYVMLDLTLAHGRVPARDTHGYVTALEEWLILTLARFGVRGERRKARVGVWVVDDFAGTEAKVAAIGVRITRWVSWHGLSLNVCPDLGHYGGIIPCGITEHGVTSLRTLGVDADLADVARVMQACWPQVFA